MQSIILSRRDYREFDQIISLYTKEKGKIKALARGVKKITSKNSAHLEPFSLVEAEIIPGKEIDHLTKVVPENIFANIRRDLQKSLSAGYIVSLLDKILHEGEKDERLFAITLSWLEFVNSYKLSAISYQLMLDSYVVKLLNCLGFNITHADNIPSAEIKKDLEILNSYDWQKISNFKFQISNYQRLHDFIYKFLVYNLEGKVADWFNLAYFSGKE